MCTRCRSAAGGAVAANPKVLSSIPSSAAGNVRGVALVVVVVVWPGGDNFCLNQALTDPPRTRNWNLRLRGPTPYPLGQRATLSKKNGTSMSCANARRLPRQENSATGTRTQVARVRAEYPNQLDYSGAQYQCNHYLLRKKKKKEAWK